jgi:hypothetical protein
VDRRIADPRIADLYGYCRVQVKDCVESLLSSDMPRAGKPKPGSVFIATSSTPGTRTLTRIARGAPSPAVVREGFRAVGCTRVYAPNPFRYARNRDQLRDRSRFPTFT